MIFIADGGEAQARGAQPSNESVGGLIRGGGNDAPLVPGQPQGLGSGGGTGQAARPGGRGGSALALVSATTPRAYFSDSGGFATML